MVIDGIYYALAFSASGALLWYLIHPAFAAPLFLVALFCLYFFRDPDRDHPRRRGRGLPGRRKGSQCHR